MIEVRYQPGATPMVFYRGPRGCGSASCYVDQHGELRTLITDKSIASLAVQEDTHIDVLLPPNLDCWF